MTTAAATTLKGVILDIDGTLVDSNDAHAYAWVDALAEAGIHVEFARVRRLIGMGTDKLLPELTGIAAESRKGDALGKRRGEIFTERYLSTLQPFPATRALLERMCDRGLTLAVATSASVDDMHALLRIAGADGLIEEQASSQDAERSKPDPDILHAALQQTGFNASQVVMIGDTPYDVEAATKAGVRIIALRCGGWDDPDLAGAVAIYDDPANLLKQFEYSPLA